jgi:ubiquinone/menaquinone biosynthesis C-methylase UbiE
MNDVHIMVSQKLSSKEWRWNQSIFSDEKMTKTREEYRGYLNKETRNAQEIWRTEMNNYIDNFRGIVGDLATGLGGMFERLLESKAEFFPIATDVDPNVLAWTSKKMKEKYEKNFASVATDAKHFAFKDKAFDYLTSCAGLNNIPDTIITLSELHRALKDNGKIVAMQLFVEKNSNSYEMAKKLNAERSFVEQFFIDDLTQVGFKKVKANIVSSAIWARNPMDGLPTAGDLQYYAIVEAEK